MGVSGEPERADEHRSAARTKHTVYHGPISSPPPTTRAQQAHGPQTRPASARQTFKIPACGSATHHSSHACQRPGLLALTLDAVRKCHGVQCPRPRRPSSPASAHPGRRGRVSAEACCSVRGVVGLLLPPRARGLLGHLVVWRAPWARVGLLRGRPLQVLADFARMAHRFVARQVEARAREAPIQPRLHAVADLRRRDGQRGPL